MHAKSLSLLAAILLGSATFGAQAQTADDYISSAVVTDQSPASRDKGLRDSLSIVLTRVGGAKATGAKVALLLARADAFVQQFDYNNNDKGELLIIATFDQPAVDAALKSLGFAVWGINTSPVDDVALSISGITNPRAYARALNYLRALPGMKNVSVLVLAGDVVYLRLRSEGGAARLTGALSVGGVLKRLDKGDTRELAYALQR
ncbi:DUF2066 domain-containing protein [Stenotrophobium rhamnosiphilum]|uniref:Uncharacterized protein n=1 Tax=Stenotrophobium rhamnosiphilum TaxID=2029166 RepID=A0A2T5MJW3_9GAMM|nr:DUF2066 domain-containing protein [Stenotrophobium rhamnosiphilum]PTU32876.1 hypothetical protein CJD38_01820 [Stenotrophobium rhamnosiphilum]